MIIFFSKILWWAFDLVKKAWDCLGKLYFNKKSITQLIITIIVFLILSLSWLVLSFCIWLLVNEDLPDTITLNFFHPLIYIFTLFSPLFSYVFYDFFRKNIQWLFPLLFFSLTLIYCLLSPMIGKDLLQIAQDVSHPNNLSVPENVYEALHSTNVSRDKNTDFDESKEKLLTDNLKWPSKVGTRIFCHLALANINCIKNNQSKILENLDAARNYSLFQNRLCREEVLLCCSRVAIDYASKVSTSNKQVLFDYSLGVMDEYFSLDLDEIHKIGGRNLLAKIYMWEGQYNLALDNFKNNEKYYANKPTPDKYVLHGIYVDIAACYIGLCRYHSALKYLSNADQVLPNIQNDQYRLFCYFRLHQRSNVLFEINEILKKQKPQNIFENAFIGMAYQDKRSLQYYGDALGQIDLSKDELNESLYRQLAAICNEEYSFLKFDYSDFKLNFISQ